MRKPVLMSWSGGKNSCLVLHEFMQDETIRAETLLTTVARDYDRISMRNRVPRFLLVLRSGDRILSRRN